MEYIQILENNRPWDCEIFPESKTICYGGGGGPKIDLTPPKPPVIKAPTFNIPEVNMPHVNVPDISGMNLTPSQGNLDALSSFGKNVTGALDRNIGQDSDFGRAMSANVGAINEGISHNVKQVGIGGQMLGNMLQGGIKSLMSLGQGGGGGGGSGGGGGAMGPSSGGLARLGASKLQQKKAGMGRRQTYLTKG